MSLSEFVAIHVDDEEEDSVDSFLDPAEEERERVERDAELKGIEVYFQETLDKDNNG